MSFCSLGVLCCTEAFYLDVVLFVHFAFVSLARGDVFRKKLLMSIFKRFLPIVSSKSFMVS